MTLSAPATTAKAPTMTGLEWLLLLSLSVLWGGSFFFGKVALAGLPPFTLVFGRVALAAAALHLVVLATGRRVPATGEAWRAFFAMGVLNNLIPFSLIFWGQTQIASGLASILNATTPLFTALVAHVLTADEKLNAGRIAGVLLGIAGVAVMIGPGALTGFDLHIVAELAVLAAALSYGFAGVFGRRFRRLGLAPVVTATGQLTATTAMMLPLSLIVDHPWALPMPALEVWAALIGLALLSTALAYILFFRILAGAGATNVSLVTLLIPASALILGGAILGERFAWTAFAGLALIAAGLIVIDGRLIRRARSPH